MTAQAAAPATRRTTAAATASDGPPAAGREPAAEVRQPAGRDGLHPVEGDPAADPLELLGPEGHERVREQRPRDRADGVGDEDLARLGSAHTRAAMFTAPPTGPSPVASVSPAWIPTPTRIGRSAVLAAPAASTIASPASTAAEAVGKTT